MAAIAGNSRRYPISDSALQATVSGDFPDMWSLFKDVPWIQTHPAGVRLHQRGTWAPAGRRPQRAVLSSLRLRGLPAQGGGIGPCFTTRQHFSAREGDRPQGEVLLMPYAAPHPCAHPGCRALTHERRCREHRREEWREQARDRPSRWRVWLISNLWFWRYKRSPSRRGIVNAFS